MQRSGSMAPMPKKAKQKKRRADDQFTKDMKGVFSMVKDTLEGLQGSGGASMTTVASKPGLGGSVNLTTKFLTVRKQQKELTALLEEYVRLLF